MRVRAGSNAATGEVSIVKVLGRPLLTTALLAVVWAGCVDFDEQTVYVEHHQARDRLLLIINYKGIHAGPEYQRPGKHVPKEATQPDVSRAMKELRKAVRNRTVAFVHNSPPPARLARLLNWPDAPEYRPHESRSGLRRLAEHVRVLNAGFYADGSGSICGAQVVIIEPASEAIALANSAINEEMLAAASELHAENAEEGQVDQPFLQRTREGRTWLELEGHSLILAIPMTERQLKEARFHFFLELLDVPADRSALYIRGLQQLLSNPVLAWHANGMLKVQFGVVSEPSVFVALPQQGNYRANLAEDITSTYGLHVDANLARYLAKPEAPAETEAERAARLMAPRLTPAEKVRVLIHQRETEPAQE